MTPLYSSIDAPVYIRWQIKNKIKISTNIKKTELCVMNVSKTWTILLIANNQST